MIGFIRIIWWVGSAILAISGLILEFGLVSDFVGPILAWILVMTFGIPFAPILPVFAYLIYGLDAAIITGGWLLICAFWWYGGMMFFFNTD